MRALDELLDLSSENISRDHSGTPIFFLDEVRRRGDLALLDEVDPADVAIEYPFDQRWREQLGYSRFVRLRRPHQGKWHALVGDAIRPAGNRRSRRRTSQPKPSPAEISFLPYGEKDPLGSKFGLDGAFLMAYLTRDQMHPPMVDDERLWSDTELWPEAAREHTRAAARLLAPSPGDRILDVGCGIGGPARLLVDEFDCRIHGIANSELMLATAERLNEARPEWRERITVELHDCQDPLKQSGFDAAWSMNMIFHVADQEAMLRNIAAVLRPRGRLMLEDWMYTARVTEAEREEMVHHFLGSSIISVDRVPEMLEQAGFAVGEIEDLGHVGRTLMPRYFVPLFDREIRPQLESDFPARPHSEQDSGKQMADEWVACIELTNRLYAEGKLTYRRYLAERR